MRAVHEGGALSGARRPRHSGPEAPRGARQRHACRRRHGPRRPVGKRRAVARGRGGGGRAADPHAHVVGRVLQGDADAGGLHPEGPQRRGDRGAHALGGPRGVLARARRDSGRRPARVRRREGHSPCHRQAPARRARPRAIPPHPRARRDGRDGRRRRVPPERRRGDGGARADVHQVSHPAQLHDAPRAARRHGRGHGDAQPRYGVPAVRRVRHGHGPDGAGAKAGRRRHRHVRGAARQDRRARPLQPHRRRRHADTSLRGPGAVPAHRKADGRAGRPLARDGDGAAYGRGRAAPLRDEACPERRARGLGSSHHTGDPGPSTCSARRVRRR
mmetsp:Transcript_50249/g.155254  ORF Transcript_50249/g.155254 Transcript_50249/m.155254 type:complete len:331 (+) Transcript_50249:148-1140(+)